MWWIYRDKEQPQEKETSKNTSRIQFSWRQFQPNTATVSVQDHNFTSAQIATRDQIIIGTSSNKIREEALKQSWNLEQIKREGMQIESALHGVAELPVEAQLNKVGQYSKL